MSTARRLIVICVIVVVSLAGLGYLVIDFTMRVDEAFECKMQQWWAGGKKEREVDLVSNITFRREGAQIVADFRRLDQAYSNVCLTSIYQPGSYYIGLREARSLGARGGHSIRTVGCWQQEKDDDRHLTIVMTNRRTQEGEYYRIPVPADFLLARGQGPVLETNYRIPELPDGHYQCSDMSQAVARCSQGPGLNPDYCLLVFHR